MVSYETVVEDVRSQACRCGRDKKPKQYLCSACYFALPEAYRRRLWIPWARLSRAAICTLYTRCLNRLGLLHGEGGQFAQSA